MTVKERFKQNIAATPIAGPFLRSIYHRAKVLVPDDFGLLGKKNSSCNIVGHKRVLLCGTQIFDGYATISNPDAAEDICKAIELAAQETAVIIMPSRIGNEIRIAFEAEQQFAFTNALSTFFGVRLRWSRDSQRDVTRLVIRWGDVLPITLRATLYQEFDEKVYSGDTKNPELRNVHMGQAVGNGEHLPQNGCHRVAALLGGETVPTQAKEIDVVYTWVNHEDPEWQKLRAAVGAHATYNPNETEQASDNAGSLSRFISRDELRYSLRSVERYMPWVRRIFVLTNCARPTWLEENDRVFWVPHDEIIAPENLPCFNSHAIEAHLHLIPELSENFIYLNDDFFISRPVQREHFFASNGLSNANLEDYGMVNGAVNNEDKDYLNAARNGAALLREAFGVSPTRLHKHTPYALRRSVLYEIEKRFPTAMEQTRAAQLRSITDVSFASFFYHHYAYCSAKGTQNGYRGEIVKNTTPNLKSVLRTLKRGQGAWVFCLNDGEDSHLDDRWNSLIPEFLERCYPIPTAYEAVSSDSKEV